MNRSSCFFIATVLSFGLATPSAQAQVVPIFQDNFESYADQAAFNAAWPVVGTQPSCTWSTDQSVSPTHSILSPAVTTAQGNTFAGRNFHTFTATPPTASNSVVYNFSFYDTTATNASYRQYANMQAGASPATFGQLVSMGLNNNIVVTFYMARILSYDGGNGVSAYFQLDGTGVGTSPPGRSTGWHLLQAVLSPTQIDLYVDGTLARSAVAGWATPPSYDRVLLGSGLSNNGNAAYFDNVLFGTQAVPEPSSLLLLGVGVFGIVRRWRRRNRA